MRRLRSWNIRALCGQLDPRVLRMQQAHADFCSSRATLCRPPSPIFELPFRRYEAAESPSSQRPAAAETWSICVAGSIAAFCFPL